MAARQIAVSVMGTLQRRRHHERPCRTNSHDPPVIQQPDDSRFLAAILLIHHAQPNGNILSASRLGRVWLLLNIMQTHPFQFSTEIMVVDGFQETREIFKELLELGGYSASTAEDGAQALSRMSEHLVPIVIIDEDLPDFNGAALSACLKAMAGDIWHGAQCITIAVRGDALYGDASGWANFDHVLVKPLDFERFDALLAKAVQDVKHRPTSV